MTGDEFETAADIEGINHARDVLGVERDATTQEVVAAFDANADGTTGEEYWKFVKAREVVLAESLRTGTAIYEILHADPHPDEIASLAQAEELLQVQKTSPTQIGVDNYTRIVRKSHDEIQDRLEQLWEQPDSPVTAETCQAIEVCYHALRFQDLRKGRRWGTGPTADSSESEPEAEPDTDDDGTDSSHAGPTDDDLLTGWKYSIDRGRDIEYYASSDTGLLIVVEPTDDNPGGGYEVSRMRDGTRLEAVTHSRYGNAKRQVRRWILEAAPSTS